MLSCSNRGSDGGEQPAVASQAHHRLLQLLEGANLDLANAFAADAVDLAQLLQRLGIIGQAPLGQDVLRLFAELGWPASESDY